MASYWRALDFEVIKDREDVIADVSSNIEIFCHHRTNWRFSTNELEQRFREDEENSFLFRR